ncbi:hypothetical protein MMC26_007567 [Xylographa opegraphella]|nr:hypothetical protein [Xylographa opegraphella]
MDRTQILTPRAIESLIADGHYIVIHDGQVLRLDGWSEKHPGGKLAIRHMVGRDATDEINVYHSAKTVRLMAAFRIGRIQAPWTNLTPPIRGGVFRKYQDEEESISSRSDDEEPPLASDVASVNSSTTSLELAADDDLKLDSGPLIRSTSKTLECDGYGSDNSHEVNHRRAFQAKADIFDPYSDLKGLTGRPLIKDQTRDAFTLQTMQDELQRDLENYPSLDAVTQRNITEKYQALHQRVKDEGYYDCRYIEYGKEFVRYTLLFVLFLVCLRAEWYMTSAVFLALFWQQTMFTAHDAGHRGITHNFVIDTLVGLFIADFCCGLSLGWWKSSHNVHHLVTNSPVSFNIAQHRRPDFGTNPSQEHDPDIQNCPMFVTGPTFFKSVRSSYYDFTFAWTAAADFLVRYQQYTYYPTMFIARFNLYLLSWLHLLSPRSQNLGSASWTRSAEIGFMLCYWYLFGYLLLWRSIPTWTLRVAFVLVSHVLTFPLHVQITLSHWATSTADLGDAESFPQRQLRTTMDVDCPTWLDFVHGGLQFQAVHHLFPRVPRHNLRKLQTLVKQFCTETGIEYKILGFVDGNKEVLSRLGEVGKQVEMLVQCQKYMAETGESGLH